MSKTVFKTKEAPKVNRAGLPELAKPSTTRLEKYVGDKMYYMEVTKPSILSYRLYSEKLASDDVYGAIDAFINGCIINSSPECGANDSLVDDSIKVLFIKDISGLYLKKVSIAFGLNECSLDQYKDEYLTLETKYPEIYSIYIDDKILFLKKPNRLEFKQLFNSQLESGLGAFELTYELLRIGGCELSIETEQEIFMACSNVPDRIISNKFLELKKK